MKEVHKIGVYGKVPIIVGNKLRKRSNSLRKRITIDFSIRNMLQLFTKLRKLFSKIIFHFHMNRIVSRIITAQPNIRYRRTRNQWNTKSMWMQIGTDKHKLRINRSRLLRSQQSHAQNITIRTKFDAYDLCRQSAAQSQQTRAYGTSFNALNTAYNAQIYSTHT